ncbi:MAG: transposase [Kiritimatiellales bacterium]|nr:transposase [Kiritimatiellales bacterium]
MREITRQKKSALQIIKRLNESGFTAYFAGGCVRDEILGREPKDYDVATDALPDEVEALFPKTLALGKAFGVIAVVDGKEITEVATFRKESGTLDGRRPETVVFCAAEEDAKRRDFTINGMFQDPVAGKLMDFVGGQEDLRKNIVRAIGNPRERFQEDHLRLLRAVRFAHTLGFDIEPGTESAIREMAGLITKISIERIEQEFSRLLTESPKPGDGLRQLAELGLLRHIIPEMIPMIGQEQPPQFHPEGDVFEHTVLMLNLMNDGQTRKSAPHTTDAEQVEQTFLSAHPEDEHAANPHVEQTFLSAHPEDALAANPHVEQTFLSAHSEDEHAANPFRPMEETEALHRAHRRLPHWNQDSRIYFVTFRLADSIAQEKLNHWKEELDTWRANQPEPGSAETLNEQSLRYHEMQEEWLDKGHGSCLLQQPEVSGIVEQTLLHFDGDRYRLGDYVVMPNHVHLIVEPINSYSLPQIMKSWKGFSAREINKLKETKGSVWMDESFDHIIRREFFFHKFGDYIQENPAKAHLKPKTYRLGNGILELPPSSAGQTGKSAPHTADAEQVEQTFLPAHQKENPAKAHLKPKTYRLGNGILELPSSSAGQTGKSAPHTTDAEQVEQTFLSAHQKENPAKAHLKPKTYRLGNGILELPPSSAGQTGKSAPHTTDTEQVEQTFLSAHPEDEHAANPHVEQTFLPAHQKENPAKTHLKPKTYRLGNGILELPSSSAGQTRKSAPHTTDAEQVEQTFLSAHPKGKTAYSPRELAYTLLLHDVGKPPTASIGPGTDGQPRIRFDGHATVSAEMAEIILRRLKLPKKELQHIVEAIRGHMRFMDVQKMRVSKLRKLIGAETFDLEMELHRLDCLGSHEMLDNYAFLNDYMEEMANEPILPEPWLRGHDLIAMGFTEGRLIGKILKEAYDAQMEDRFENRDQLLEWIKTSHQPPNHYLP